MSWCSCFPVGILKKPRSFQSIARGQIFHQCQSNIEVQGDLYQIPSYIDSYDQLTLPKATSFPEAQSVLGSSVPRVATVGIVSGHLRLHGAPCRGGGGGPQWCRNTAAQRRVAWHDTATLRGSDGVGTVLLCVDTMIHGGQLQMFREIFESFGSSACCQFEGMK